MNDLWAIYTNHLINRCYLTKERKFYRIFKYLNDKPFVYVYQRDYNRVEDAMILRKNFIIPPRFEQLTDKFMDRDPSVLEIMVALSIRVDNDIIGDLSEEHPDLLFMEMIGNLGIRPNESFENLDKIINTWLLGMYDSRGHGSPFPIFDTPNVDMRDYEIWDQVNIYINEHYR